MANARWALIVKHRLCISAPEQTAEQKEWGETFQKTFPELFPVPDEVTDIVYPEEEGLGIGDSSEVSMVAA